MDRPRAELTSVVTVSTAATITNATATATFQFPSPKLILPPYQGFTPLDWIETPEKASTFSSIAVDHSQSANKPYAELQLQPEENLIRTSVNYYLVPEEFKSFGVSFQQTHFENIYPVSTLSLVKLAEVSKT